MTVPTISDVQAAYVAHTGGEHAAEEFDTWLQQITGQVADGVTQSRLTGRTLGDFAAGALALAQVNRVVPTQDARWEAAIDNLRTLCRERPEAPTELLEALNTFLLNHGNLQLLTLLGRVTDPRHLNPNHRNWVSTQSEIIACTTDGAEWGRGTAIAYTDRPTLTIQREDGTRFSWIADLCTPAAEQHLKETTP
ncbi:hypothetical protein [Microbacterium sp. NPDC080220]|uniref:hypothetical protein n=1 Tax=Microbacterium sp. NPDC080220 TaxID=3161017 RepID=UPI003430EB6F